MAFTRLKRWTQIWIVVTLFSLMIYDLYWIHGVFTLIYSILIQNLPDILAKHPNFYYDYVAGAIANSLRMVGVILVLLSAYLVWGPKRKLFTNVRKYVAVALSFEAVYFLAILPLNLILIIRERSPFLLYLGFVIQILVTSPLLLALSIKAWHYKETARANLVQWACLVGIGYIIGIWVNSVFRWFSMSESAGTGLLLTGITSLGFFSSVIILSLSLTFAIAGFYTLLNKGSTKSTVRLFGVSLIMLGLHFIIYIIYSWIAPGAWKFVLLTEIWPIPLLPVGLGMLKGEI
jgi:hypothetical protein